MESMTKPRVNLSSTGYPDKLFSKYYEKEHQQSFYKVEDKMPLVLSLLNAVQMIICQVMSLVWIPLCLTPALCILPADPIRVYLLSTVFLTSGVVTLLQSALGIRLPTLAVPSVIYASSLLSLLHDPDLQCPSDGDLYAMGLTLRTEEWQRRLREVQGVFIFAGIVQVCLGFSGLEAYLSKVLSPVVVATTVILAGISFSREAITGFGGDWTTSSTIVAMLVILFALCLRETRFPLLTFSFCKGLTAKWFPLFRMFPVLCTFVAVYVFCGLASAFEESSNYTHKEVVTFFEEAVDNSQAIYFLLPFEWGWPTLSMKSVIYILPTIFLQSAISCAAIHASFDVCDIASPPQYVVSRGLTVEGLGLLFGSLWANGVTISPSNIGLLSFTGIASRSSTILAALLMIVLSFFTCITSNFAKIPTQLLSACNICLYAGLVCVGVSMLLKTSKLQCHRNCVIVAFSLLFGLVIPRWASEFNLTSETGFVILDSLVDRCSRSTYLGVAVGCVLDLVLPGEGKSGSCKKNNDANAQTQEEEKIYRLPTWEEFVCNTLESLYCFPQGKNIKQYTT